MTPVCFLDLDGVLVDFVGGAFATHGRSLPMPDVRWDFPSQIGFAGGANDPAFWEPMGRNFWANLDWTPEGKDILHVVEQVFGRDNIAVMTSPCDTEGAVEGKVAWIKQNLPKYRRRFFVGPPKDLAAGPGKVLVDDHEGNVSAFAARGGLVALAPRPWNWRRNETLDGYQINVLKFSCDIQAAYDLAILRNETFVI